MNQLLLDKDRITHSIKTGLACLIGFIITKSTHLPVDQWLVITIIVVMCAQINVGSMIQKSTMRFLGTLLGSIVAAITLTFLGTNTTATGLIVTLSAILFSYMATGKSNLSEAGTLGAVTVAIILIGQNPTLTMAAGRFLEISLGIFIAALVSQFILPIHARNLLRRKQIQAIRLLRSYYLATLLTDQNATSALDYHEIDDNIINSLLSQRKLATEAQREPFAKKNTLVAQFSSILGCEREIQRAITFMHHAYKSSPECKILFSNKIIVNEFHDKICDIFEVIALHIEKKRFRDFRIQTPSLQPIEQAIAAEKNRLSAADITYTSAFLFCAEILVAQLNHLAQLITSK